MLQFAELFKRGEEDEKIVNMYVHLACFFGGYSYVSNLSSHSVCVRTWILHLNVHSDSASF